MVLVPQAVFVFIHPHPPPAPAPSRAQVWAAIPAWVSMLDVYCRLESRKHWEGWSKTLDHILKKKIVSTLQSLIACFSSSKFATLVTSHLG